MGPEVALLQWPGALQTLGEDTGEVAAEVAVQVAVSVQVSHAVSSLPRCQRAYIVLSYFRE